MRQPFFFQAWPRFDQVYWSGWSFSLRNVDEAELVEHARSHARSSGRKPEFFWFERQFLRSISLCAMFQSPHRMISWLRCQPLQMNQEVLGKRNFDACRCGPAEPGRHVVTQLEARLDVAALGVELAVAKPRHLVRGLAAIKRDAAVALLLRERVAGLVDLEAVELRVEVDLLALHLLQAHHVGALGGEPAEQLCLPPSGFR